MFENVKMGFKFFARLFAKYGLSPALGAMLHISLPLFAFFFYHFVWIRHLKMFCLEGHPKGYVTTTLQFPNTLRRGSAKGRNSDWALNTAGSIAMWCCTKRRWTSDGNWRSDEGWKYLLAGQSCFVFTKRGQSISAVLDGEESEVRTETGAQQAARSFS